MPRKKRKESAQSAPAPAEPAFHQPFGALGELKKHLAPKAEPPASAQVRPAPAPPPPPPADDFLFQREMADVVPLAGRSGRRRKDSPPPKAWKTPELPDEDLEVLRSLSDLVSGQAEFDLTYSDEYVEGQTRGLSPRLMERLRSGRIPVQDHLDLHGLTVARAEAAVARFVLNSVALGRRCVLLIHGRGLGSQDGIPVLKRNLETFLLRGAARKYLLAFTTARPVDGGPGASYLLLRG